MNILTRIVKDKRKEVELRSRLIPINQLEQSILFNRSTFSLVQNLSQSATGIIAEHKRRSPSKAVINHNLNVQDVAIGYEKAGVCGMSVLTDSKYFGGSLHDLLLARASCELPLLRKEFIISEYQIIESKAFGADASFEVLPRSAKDETNSINMSDWTDPGIRPELARHEISRASARLEQLLEQVSLSDQPDQLAKNINKAVSKLIAFKNNLEEISQ